MLARWNGELEEALGRLREAGALADEIGLPGESWEIHVAVGERLRRLEAIRLLRPTW